MNNISTDQLKKDVIKTGDLGRGVVWKFTIFLTSPSILPNPFLNQQFALVLGHTHLAMHSQEIVINIYMTLLMRFTALFCVQVCSLWFDLNGLWFVPLATCSLQLCSTGRGQDCSTQPVLGASAYLLFKSPKQQGPS